ncbi:MAG: cytochrome c3 family protein [Anaerolineae bacterium]|jgi:hypothetical protein|nr:cytochrome c3 family protein [Anaerolineae bacterium]
MTATLRHRLILFCLGSGLTLLAAGILPFFVPVAQAQEQPPVTTPEAAPAEPSLTQPDNGEPVIAREPTGDNSYCAVCHSQPWRAVTLPYGTILNLFVTPDMIADSVHGTASEHGTLGCIDCHGEDVFPHNQPSPTDARSYTLNAVAMCTACHVEEAEQLATGLHEEAILAGNRNAAVCTDCHGAHDIQPGENEPDLVAGICGDCHEDTLVQWQTSAHLDIGPLGCATCHSPHSQRMRVAGGEDATCRNCHTQMPELYVHQTHLVADSQVNCLNCHMYRTDTPDGLALAGHTMHMDTQPCITCHQELVDTGRWQQLTGLNSEITAERDALQSRVLALEAAQAEPAADSNLIPTLQGLLVGLGLGMTLGIVFFTRRQSR